MQVGNTVTYEFPNTFRGICTYPLPNLQEVLALDSLNMQSFGRFDRLLWYLAWSTTKQWRVKYIIFLRLCLSGVYARVGVFLFVTVVSVGGRFHSKHRHIRIAGRTSYSTFSGLHPTGTCAFR